MKKNVVKINENALRQIVAESVKNVLKEIGETPKGQYMLGRLAGRKLQQANSSLDNGNGEEYMGKMQDADNISKHAAQAQNDTNTSSLGDNETFFERGKKDQQWHRPGSKGMPR